jgi:hypothetical protein
MENLWKAFHNRTITIGKPPCPEIILACRSHSVLLQKFPRACLPLEASLFCCDPEHLSQDTVLSEDIPLRNALDLALPYHMHRLIALQSPLGGTERAKPYGLTGCAF